ncbi:MAG: YggT family protein [Treponema sp.]|nr:YggT family protein [Treponema sp.]
MQTFFNVLSQLLNLYSLLLFARIMLTWFSGNRRSGLTLFLAGITDPYLDWWRRNFKLRAGFLDLSPIAAIAALRMVQTVFQSIAIRGTLSIGFLLTIILSAIWSIVSFLLWFCIIVLAIRLIGFYMNKPMQGMLWQIVDAISQPLIFRITRTFFRRRILNFITGIIFCIALLFLAWLGGRFLLQLLSGLLAGN